MAPRGTFRLIADALRRSIVEGERRPGEVLPPELTLAAQHHVARGTIRAALAVLVDEGLVEVVPGQGRRVRGDAVPTVAWQRIAASLRARLVAGQFAAEHRLPSETALVAEFAVSRNTVRRAYRQLVEEGAVVVRHGAGAFPAPR